MEELQSILLEDVEVRLPGFVLRRVALNQHMPRIEKLSEHVHDYHQWLVYLRGRGRQHLEERVVEVARGTVLVVEPGCRHRFVNESEVRPVCLVIDFESAHLGGRDHVVMHSPDLLEIEELLVELHAEERKSSARPLRIASLILRIAACIDGGLAGGSSGPLRGPTSRAVARAVERLGVIDLTPGKLAEEVGVSLDHLNRRLKKEAGKSVGAWINEVRLKECTTLLRTTGLTIGEIGARVGMNDQNYFARWFRKGTGQSPGQWRQLAGQGGKF